MRSIAQWIDAWMVIKELWVRVTVKIFLQYFFFIKLFIYFYLFINLLVNLHNKTERLELIVQECLTQINYKMNNLKISTI